MNKLLTIGFTIALSMGAADVSYANSTKCTAQYVAGVLQQAKVDKGDLVVPERRYGMEVNKNSVPDHMASPMQAALNDATEETIQATWVPASEGTQEMCLINLMHSNGQTTEVVIYPYAYKAKS
jgi:hypothetical protein